MRVLSSRSTYSPVSKCRRGRRRGQRGQVAPLVAIFAILLLAAAALATDLSVTTNLKRSLQNQTDAAALAAAQRLPSAPSGSEQQNATATALSLLHNTFPWPTSGQTWSGANWSSNLAGQGCGGGACSVTVCGGIDPAGATCTATVNQAGLLPFALTVNTPPKTAATGVLVYGGDHYVEVVMQQEEGTFLAGALGISTLVDGAHSVAYHFAPGQPFPFALYSRTYVQSGNDGEVISGNIYADRYVQPQSSGLAEVCAGTYVNSNGQTEDGDIFLGYPQADDGAAYNPTTDPGQSTMTHGSPIQDGGCTGSPSQVGMTGAPVSNADCAYAYSGNQSGSAIKFDATDGACEADPAIQPPTVAPLPDVPTYPAAQTYCGNSQGVVGGQFQPGLYGSIQSCNGSGQPVLNISASTGASGLAPGIYEIDPGKNTNGCDVTLDGSITSLPGVTFYLMNGAGICMTIPSGVTITQTPYNANNGYAGDGIYDVISDNVANPSITLTSGGGGSTSGIWSLTGTIWLPTGTIIINNKTALEDQGQIVVDTWNDQSGYHPNPSVSYNPAYAPPQQEALRLVQ